MRFCPSSHIPLCIYSTNTGLMFTELVQVKKTSLDDSKSAVVHVLSLADQAGFPLISTMSWGLGESSAWGMMVQCVGMIENGGGFGVDKVATWLP